MHRCGVSSVGAYLVAQLSCAHTAGHTKFVPMIDRVGTIGKIAVLGQHHRDYLLYASGTVAMMAGLESDFLSKLHLYLAEGMY